MIPRGIADFDWRNGELVRLSAKDRASALATLFAHMESAMDTAELSADINRAEASAISQETWLTMRELGRIYGLLAEGLKVAGDRRQVRLDPLTASRMTELMLAISAAEARLIGAFAQERQRWLDEFLSQS